MKQALSIRRLAAMPSNPSASSVNVPGSGTVVVDVVLTSQLPKFGLESVGED